MWFKLCNFLVAKKYELDLKIAEYFLQSKNPDNSYMYRWTKLINDHIEWRETLWVVEIEMGKKKQNIEKVLWSEEIQQKPAQIFFSCWNIVILSTNTKGADQNKQCIFELTSKIWYWLRALTSVSVIWQFIVLFVLIHLLVSLSVSLRKTVQ